VATILLFVHALALANTALCFNIAMWQQFYCLVHALALANTALCFNIAMWQQFYCLVHALALANTALCFNITMWQQLYYIFMPWRRQILRSILTFYFQKEKIARYFYLKQGFKTFCFLFCRCQEDQNVLPRYQQN
jgi:hypothetical protein